MNSLTLTLLAAATLGEKLADACTVTIVGMGTVFLSLWVIGEIFNLLQRFFARRDRLQAAGPGPEGGIDKPQMLSPSEDAHLVPILVAAATAAVGRRVVLRRITFINRDTVSGWAEAGRTSIQQSHNLRRTN